MNISGQQPRGPWNKGKHSAVMARVSPDQALNAGPPCGGSHLPFVFDTIA